MKKIYLILGFGILAAVIGVGAIFLVFRNQSRSSGNNIPRPDQVTIFDKLSGAKNQPSPPNDSLDLNKQWSNGKCQGSGVITFTHSPMKMEDFASITPYGLVVDAHVTPIDHMYFNPADWHSKRDQYEVRAIADGYIVKIGHRMNFVGDQKSNKKTDEWRLDIEHTCDLYSYFDLITSLDPAIAKEVRDILDKQSSKQVRIPIQAGQIVGRIGGQTLDFGVYNNTKWLNFIVPEHYTRETWKIHTDDPFPYFVESLCNQLIAKNQRTAEPIAGKIDYDIDGKLIGNWFKEGTNGYAGINQQRYWDGHLALLYNHLDPTAIVISIGDWNGQSKQFVVVGNMPDPKDISIDRGIVKYELVQSEYINGDTGERWDKRSPIKNPKVKPMDQIQGTVLFQLIEPRKLKVETFPTQKASEVSGFTNQAIIYERWKLDKINNKITWREKLSWCSRGLHFWVWQLLV